MAMAMVVYCRHHHRAKRAQMISKPPPRRAEGTRRQEGTMTILDSLSSCLEICLASTYLIGQVSPLAMLQLAACVLLLNRVKVLALGSGGTSAGTRWSFLTYMMIHLPDTGKFPSTWNAGRPVG